jgi:hypothetical protein
MLAPDPASLTDDPPPPSDPTALERPTVNAFQPLLLSLPLSLPVPESLGEPPPPPTVEPPPPTGEPQPPQAEPPPPEAEPPAPLVEVAAAAELPTPEPSLTDEPVEAPVELPYTTNRRLVPAIAGAVVVVLGIGWLVFGRGSETPPPPTALTSVPSHSVRPPSTPPDPQPTPAATSAAPAGTAPPARSTAETTLRIETVPPAASIVVDGAPVGASPMDVKLPRSDKPVVVELRHAGYEPVRESIVPDVDQKMRFSLEPTHAAATAPKPKATSTATANPYRRFD